MPAAVFERAVFGGTKAPSAVRLPVANEGCQGSRYRPGDLIVIDPATDLLLATFLASDRVVLHKQFVIATKAVGAVAVSTGRRSSPIVIRSLSSDKSGKEMPFGLGKMLGISDPDNLIATDRDRRIHKGDIPDFLPEDVKKDMDALGLDNMQDLDELEDANLDGYNDLGLVPPEGSGTFASPILIPSRRSSRAVGYVDPESHATFWFNIHNDDNTYYIKDLGLFFKMLHIPDEEAFGGHH